MGKNEETDQSIDLEAIVKQTQAEKNQQRHDDGHAKRPQRSKRRLVIRGLVIALLVLLLIGLGAGVWLFVDSTKAINDYIEQVNQQYTDITERRNMDEPNVELRSVCLGDVVNPRYRQMKDLTDQYQTLIDALRNYTQAIGIHNQMVEEFNCGLEDGATLSSNIYNLVGQMIGEVEDNYPERTAELAGLQQLQSKIAASTSFAEVSGDFNAVLRADSEWLASEHDSIEAKRQAFQDQINAI